MTGLHLEDGFSSRAPRGPCAFTEQAAVFHCCERIQQVGCVASLVSYQQQLSCGLTMVALARCRYQTQVLRIDQNSGSLRFTFTKGRDIFDSEVRSPLLPQTPVRNVLSTPTKQTMLLLVRNAGCSSRLSPKCGRACAGRLGACAGPRWHPTEPPLLRWTSPCFPESPTLNCVGRLLQRLHTSLAMWLWARGPCCSSRRSSASPQSYRVGMRSKPSQSRTGSRYPCSSTCSRCSPCR